LCVLQDHISRMVIGVGKHKYGLYYLCGAQRLQVKKADNVDCMELWHKRLGHPSFKVTELISGFGKNKFENCDICFRAKQCRENFPIREQRASGIFEMIHCDLWGPYRTSSSCGAYYFMTIVDDFSRNVWIYLLVDKNEVSKFLLNFKVIIKV